MRYWTIIAIVSIVFFMFAGKVYASIGFYSPPKINQVNFVEEAKNSNISLPVDKHNFNISSGYGYRSDPFTQKKTFHHGIDIPAPAEERVYSVDSGKVITSTYSGSAGNFIVIDHGDFLTRYLHLSNRKVQVGDSVDGGCIIGTIGSTGRSTGPHLHFEIIIDGKTVDPMDYLNKLDNNEEKSYPKWEKVKF